MTATTGPKMSAPAHVGRVAERDPFRLTGDSHADLERMANACAPAPAAFASMEHHRLRGVVGDQIDLLGRLIGPGAVEQLRRAWCEVESQAWTLERICSSQGDRIDRLSVAHAEAVGERERARNTACTLEAEVAMLRSSSYAAQLEHQLRMLATLSRGGTDGIDGYDAEPFIANARTAAAEAGLDPEPLVFVDSAGLPVVDDATLGAGDVIFRRGDVTIAVGRLDRVFGPLDQATEIALGADTTPPVDGARPLDEGI